MKIIDTKDAMRSFAEHCRTHHQRVGLVPTMGALHEGHLSLIRAARRDCDIVVVSIFVNPTQFGPAEDLAKYPRTFDADCLACREAGADAVFAPPSGQMYPAGFDTFVVQEKLSRVLEGASRPTHFRGVLTIVLKLFNIVAPDIAYFGQKDFQQTVVIRRMAADLDLPVEIRVLPTVREPDGLAMSSRNRYLNPDERRQAACLHDALEHARAQAARDEQSPAALKADIRARIDKQPLLRLDYVEIIDPDTLEPAEHLRPGVVAVIAAHVGSTRLIDNAILL